MKEDDYSDIINLPHWEPKNHQRMSPEQRAAQFAPFAALTGHDEALAEITEKFQQYVESVNTPGEIDPIA